MSSYVKEFTVTARDGYPTPEERKGIVRVEIDELRLVQSLGGKALFTKSGRSTGLNGCVRVRVIKREGA